MVIYKIPYKSRPLMKSGYEKEGFDLLGALSL